MGVQGPANFIGKTRRKSTIWTPERGHSRNSPPISGSGGIFTRRPQGGSRAQNRLRSRGNGPKTRGTAPRAPAGTAHESVGRTVRPTAPWGVPSSYAFSTWIGAPRPRIPRVLPRGSNTEPAGVPEGPQGGHERHPPPQPETGPRKHRENRGSLEFPHRIPRYLSGRRKPGRKGDGKYRYFGTTGCCIRVRIRGFPISGGQIGPKSPYCPA